MATPSLCINGVVSIRANYRHKSRPRIFNKDGIRVCRHLAIMLLSVSVITCFLLFKTSPAPQVAPASAFEEWCSPTVKYLGLGLQLELGYQEVGTGTLFLLYRTTVRNQGRTSGDVKYNK